MSTLSLARAVLACRRHLTTWDRPPGPTACIHLSILSVSNIVLLLRELGSPNMNQWPGKYGRSSATFKDTLNSTDEREGLWGSHLPIISFQHTIIGPPSNGPGATCGHCSGHCHNTSVEPAGGCKFPCATGSNGQCCVPCHAPATCKSPCKPCQHHPLA